jgi:hypothetical protein
VPPPPGPDCEVECHSRLDHVPAQCEGAGRISVIILRLRVVNLRSGVQRRPDGETVGGGEESRQALGVAFVALQVVGQLRSVSSGETASV